MKPSKINQFFQSLDRDSTLTLIGIALLLVTWALGYIARPSGRFLFLLVIALLMLAFFLLILADRLRLESRMDAQLARSREALSEYLSNFANEMRQVLDRRLPNTEFIRGSEKVESELTSAAREAQRFIMATGGKSRIEPYLETIERKVKEEGISYTRIIFGDYIHHELCKHLTSLLGEEKVFIGHARDEKSGTALVTDNVLIFTTIPSTRADVFDTVVKVPDAIAAGEYREYLLGLWARSIRLETVEELQALCLECGKGKESVRGSGTRQ